MAHEAARRVVRLSLRPLVLAPIRLALGLAGLGAAVLGGARGSVALLAFVIGAVGAAALLTSDPRGRRRHPAEPVPLVAGTAVDSWSDVARTDIFPSTAGVTVLTGAALAFDPGVAALLAGVLAGMALATVVGALQIAASERTAGGRLFAERNGGRLFVELRRPD